MRFSWLGSPGWTDELGKQHMTYWCCAQAKDYGYILENGKSEGKKLRVLNELEKQKRK